jgi:micrococcal nuclease
MADTKTKTIQGWQFKYAKVVEVHDGDTLRILIDQGFGNFTQQDIRVKGINTPEIFGEEKEQGLAAKAFVEKLLPVGTPVSIVSYQTKSGKDKRTFTRYVADVFFTDITGVSVSLGDYLLKQGIAKPFMI